jgi:hypothetical protein
VTVFIQLVGGSNSRDRMVVGFTTTYSISAHHHFSLKQCFSPQFIYAQYIHSVLVELKEMGFFSVHIGVIRVLILWELDLQLKVTLCDKVCQWLAAGQWFSTGTLVFSTNKTDHHDITEILLKVALNSITLLNPTPKEPCNSCVHVNIIFYCPCRNGLSYQKFNINVCLCTLSRFLTGN